MKITLLLSLLMGLSLHTIGQAGERHEERKEKLEAMKVAYITQKLDLDSKEAQKFWPVYNEMQAETEKVKMDARKNFVDRKPIDEMTDKEVEEQINQELDNAQKVLDIRKLYVSKLKAVLPIHKIAMLYKAERDFNREVLQEFKRREGGSHQGSDSPGKRF